MYLGINSVVHSFISQRYVLLNIVSTIYSTRKIIAVLTVDTKLLNCNLARWTDSRVLIH